MRVRNSLNILNLSTFLKCYSGMFFCFFVFRLHRQLQKSTIFKVLMNEGVVSKETVVLRRWESSIQKFGFINGVDNVNWPPYRDSKS